MKRPTFPKTLYVNREEPGGGSAPYWFATGNKEPDSYADGMVVAVYKLIKTTVVNKNAEFVDTKK